jgi:hypothetical protein
MVKKNNKTNPKSDKSSHEQQLMVLVENLGDEIKLVAEGNLMLRQTMDSRFDTLEGKFDLLESDMHSSSKTIIDYLSRIED